MFIFLKKSINLIMMKKIIKKISFRIIRNVHNIYLRNLLCSILKLFLPKIELFSDNNVLNLNDSEESILNSLQKEGVADLGIVLSETKITSIINELKTLNCYDLDNENFPIVDLNDVSKTTQLANYKREDLTAIPEIIQIANDSRIINIISKYLGVKPTISNINCWWSFGDREVAKEAQYFHRDVDDYKFVKMFFYLTDVNEENGPHIFVKGSHKINKLLQLRRFNDNEVAENFKNQIITLVRPKGSCFIEDTYGIHKGQLPVNGKRLLLQIQYSYLPLHVENYSPNESTLLEILNLDKYINRLVLK